MAQVTNEKDLRAQLIGRSHWLRKELFELVVRARKGHVPSSYSCAEMICALFYGGFVKVHPDKPRHPERDRVLVSKGHAAMVLYPVLADLGFYPKEELPKFTKADGLLRMYADPSIPGIESITGSLGHALGIACGYALTAKRDKLDYKNFVIVGDGELYEGSVWESAMFAAHHKLDNLVLIVDRNKLCIIDDTENCVRLNPIEDKFKAFDWNCISIDGHRYSEIFPALRKATQDAGGRPTAIIANTIKGKGISFMEGNPRWHNKIPNEEQAMNARFELETNCITD